MTQKHDIGFQKQAMNAKMNPRALSHEGRVVRRNRARRLAALDLFEKTGRLPKGWDSDNDPFDPRGR